VPRRKRPVMFRLIIDDEHPQAEQLWQRVEKEALGNDPLIPKVLVDLYFDDEVREKDITLEEAEAVQAWCLERPWWPEKGPAPLRWEKIPTQRGPEPGEPRKAGILVPLTEAERSALNDEAARMGLTQRELARRKVLRPL
jgi:hypothetical protein